MRCPVPQKAHRKEKKEKDGQTEEIPRQVTASATSSEIPKEVDIKNKQDNKPLQQQQQRRSKTLEGNNTKVAEKAEELTRKRNLEGTNLTTQNSFGLLDDEIILEKVSNMGIQISINDMQTINILRDMEIARHHGTET